MATQEELDFEEFLRINVKLFANRFKISPELRQAVLTGDYNEFGELAGDQPPGSLPFQRIVTDYHTFVFELKETHFVWCAYPKLFVRQKSGQ